MKIIRAWSVAWSAAAAVAACGGNTSDGDGQGGGAQYVSREDFAETFPTRLCQQLSSCCDKLSSSVSEPACRAELDDFVQEILGGGGGYDGVAAASCMNAYLGALARCQLPNEDELVSCVQIAVGTVPVGGACDGDDCVSGAYCYYDGTNAGTCQSETVYVLEPGVEGDPCNATCGGTPDGGGSDTPCGGMGGGQVDAKTCYTGQGLECNFDTLVCTRLPELGQPCSFECGGQAYCYGGVCLERTASGPCDYDDHCTTDAYCDYFELRCQPKQPDGASCEDENECLNVCDGVRCVAAESVTREVCDEF